MQKFCFTSKRFSKLHIGLCMFCELLRRQSGLLECVVLFFGHSVVSSSLWPQGLLYTRLPCPPLSPGVCSNSRPLSWLCHPTISPCVIPISPCPQSFPASGSFQMSQLFTSGGQSIGASASASVVLPMLDVEPEAPTCWSWSSNNADVEAPILWPPDVKSQLIGKDPDTGKDWGQEEKGATQE